MTAEEPDTLAGHERARSAPTSVCLHIRNGVFVLCALLGLHSLVQLASARSFNYDELSHAHTAWLLSTGSVPYRDFAANHFPFFWMLVGPIVRVLPQGSEAMMELRSLAILLNMVFIGALGALIVAELRSGQRTWGAAAFGLVVFAPQTLHVLIEFRPDALSNALLFPALLYVRVRDPPRIAPWFVAGACIGAAVLINTKYALLPLVLGGVALLLPGRRPRRIGPSSLAIGLGFGAALVAGWLLLLATGVSPGSAWRMVISYNAAAEKARTFGFGLAQAVWEHPVLLGFVVAGILAGFVLQARERRAPSPFLIAALCFLALNLATCTRPWKQYAVSWFLLAACFPARALASLAGRLRPWAQVAGAFSVLAVLTVESMAVPPKDPSGGGEDRLTQDRLIDWTRAHVPRDGYVAAGFPMHPVFRRDSFFKVVIDMTARGDDGLERLMPGAGSGHPAGHSLQSGYERELEMRPPALIVLWGLYTDAQVQALSAYAARHADVYVRGNVPGTALTVLQRKEVDAGHADMEALEKSARTER